MARRAERTTRLVVVLVLALATLTACSAAQQDGPPPRPPVAGTGAPPSDSRTPVAPPVAPPVATEAVHVPAPTAPATPPAAPEARYARPAWLGTRPLPLRDDGYGQVLPTPRRLRDRRLATPQLLPPPATTDFDARIAPVPAAVLRRSTWSAGCPVTRDDLRYVTVTFQGFDQLAHTGELLVHRTAARDMVSVFRSLYRARFPIEDMRVVAPAELDLAPTGDGNNTSAFVCRASRSSTSWSEHAYGRAVDVNPFHNPYVRDDLVLPELASAYVDRDRVRPGMVRPGDVVTQAFSDIGWGWGGNWDSLKDWMHFSANGR